MYFKQEKIKYRAFSMLRKWLGDQVDAAALRKAGCAAIKEHHH